MIFRLSQKLNDKINAGTLSPHPQHENAFADWSAHLFIMDRVQYILLTNTKTFYSTAMYGKGITNDNQFIHAAFDSIREFMTADGFELPYQHWIAPASGRVRISKALSRSVSGSMNELIALAKYCLADGDMSPHDLGFTLNDTLLSNLGGPVNRGYGKPREAFARRIEQVPEMGISG